MRAVPMCRRGQRCGCVGVDVGLVGVCARACSVRGMVMCTRARWYALVCALYCDAQAAAITVLPALSRPKMRTKNSRGSNRYRSSPPRSVNMLRVGAAQAPACEAFLFAFQACVATPLTEVFACVARAC